MKRSVETGQLVTLDHVDCVIDGLKVKRVGEYTFQVVQHYVDEVVSLPDEAIFEALIWTMSHCKLVVEGAAAAPVAAMAIRCSRLAAPQARRSPATMAMR